MIKKEEQQKNSNMNSHGNAIWKGNKIRYWWKKMEEEWEDGEEKDEKKQEKNKLCVVRMCVLFRISNGNRTRYNYNEWENERES